MTITTTTTITTSKDAIRDLSTLSCLQQVRSRGKGAIVRKLHATHQPRTTSNMSRAPRYNGRQQSGLLRQLNPFVSTFATTHQAMQTLHTHCRLLTIQHETRKSRLLTKRSGSLPYTFQTAHQLHSLLFTFKTTHQTLCSDDMISCYTH